MLWNKTANIFAHIHVLSAHMADVESNCRIRIACAFEWAAQLSSPDVDCVEAENDDDDDEGSARGGITNMAQGSDGAAASATNEASDDEDEDEGDAERARSVCNESGASAMTAHREMKLRRRYTKSNQTQKCAISSTLKTYRPQKPRSSSHSFQPVTNPSNTSGHSFQSLAHLSRLALPFHLSPTHPTHLDSSICT
jgi:hypothetical protein